MNHDTHLQSSHSIGTYSYKFDEYGNILIGTIEDLQYDKFIDKKDEISKINLNLNRDNNNSKMKSMNSLVSLSSNTSNTKDIYSNININKDSTSYFKNEKNFSSEKNKNKNKIF